jgi:hypothetical protein
MRHLLAARRTGAFSRGLVFRDKRDFSKEVATND